VPADENKIINFFRTICLCHDATMITQNHKTFISGSSMDEICLIEMANAVGLVEFVDRDSSYIRIKVRGKIETYRNLKFFDFTSERKMMSRVVQNVETEEVIVFAKGADSVIF